MSNLVVARAQMANYPPSIGDALYALLTQQNWKQPVRVASAASIANLGSVTVANFDGTGQGVTLVQNDRVLVKNNASKDGVESAAAKRNGIYVVGVVTAGVAALTRDTDASDSTMVTCGMTTKVMEGTYAGLEIVLTTANPITLDTTSLTFTSVAGAILGGAAITAGTTRTQAGATALSKGINRIDTSTAPSSGSVLGDGVALPASSPGWVAVWNNTANPIQVYPQNGSSDTINGQAAGASVIMPAYSVDIYFCAVAGAWAVEAGIGYSGSLPVEIACSNIAAAGTTQAAATQLVAALNKVTSATGGSATGVRLPAAVPGLDVLVENHSGTPIQVFGAPGNSLLSTTVAAGSNGVNVNTFAGSGTLYAQTTGFPSSGTLYHPGLGVSISYTSITGGGTPSFNNCTTLLSGAGVLATGDAIKWNDSIDDVTATTGVSQMDSSVALFTCYEAGKWYSNGLGSGYAKNQTSGSVLATVQYSDAVSAAGTTQATATQLTGAINNITTVAAGAGVALPAGAPGLSITVQNNGANPLQVYAYNGSSDTINGLSGGSGSSAGGGLAIHQGTVATFNCTTSSSPFAWTMQSTSPIETTQTSVANSDANTTLTSAQVTGAVGQVWVHMTGAITAGRNLVTPTAAQIVAALHAPTVGTSYTLYVVNAQANAQSFTMTAGSNVTLQGPGLQTIAQNTWRAWLVTVTAVGTPAVTMKSLGTGTYS